MKPLLRGGSFLLLLLLMNILSTIAMPTDRKTEDDSKVSYVDEELCETTS